MLSLSSSAYHFKYHEGKKWISEKWSPDPEKMYNVDGKRVAHVNELRTLARQLHY